MRHAEHSHRHRHSSEGSRTSSKDSSKRGGQHGHRSSSEREVDVYRSPTRLFELIDAGDDDAAIGRLHSHPGEASTWLVSRRGKWDQDDARDDDVVHERHDDDGVKWRYLPLHLACLRPSPSLPLVRSLLETYPPAIRRRDRAGNLPVHYVCLEGTEDDWGVLQFLLDAYPESLHKRGGDGRTLTQLVQDMSNSDEGSLATNGTMVARVSDFDRRRRERGSGVDCADDDGAGHRRRHQQQEEHRQEVSAAQDHQRHKSRSKSLGRISEERRDQPPPLPPNVAEGGYDYNDANRAERKGSGSAESSSSKRRSKSKSRRRGTRRGEESPEPPDSAEKELRKRLRELEGKLDAALTERDVLSDGMEKMVSKDKAREKEVKALKHGLDAALKEADEDRRAAEAEHGRVDELEEQLHESEEQCEMMRGQAEEVRQSSREKEEKLARALDAARTEASDAARVVKAEAMEVERGLKESIRAVKAEAMEVERGLRESLNALEEELAGKNGAEKRYDELVQRREADAKGRSALMLLNSSLQDQIITTKTKCNDLEQKLKEATTEREALRTRLLLASPPSSSKFKSKQQGSRSELGERQKVLHKEFNSLWSTLQSMSKDNPGMVKIMSGDAGDSANAAESLAQSMQVMTAENEAREKKIKSYRTKLDELETENTTLREEAKRAIKERLALEVEMRRVAKEGGDDNARQMLAYEAQIKELRSKNKSMRDKITKNNETYIAKVSELGDDCARLKRVGDELRQTVKDLRVECDEQKNRPEEEGGAKKSQLSVWA